MNLKPVSILLSITMAAALLSSCAEKVGTEATAPGTFPSETSSQTTTVTTPVPETTTEATTTEATTPEPTTPATTTETVTEPVSDDESELVPYYTFPDEYNAIVDRMVFVGDSICRGLEAYSILDNDKVIATGSVSAWGIDNFTFDYAGTEMTYTDALKAINPEYIVFSMGMNDVNMTSSETFCENYNTILDRVHAILPNSKLFVASITPVTADTNFTTNDTIDSYNMALKEYIENKSDYTCWFINIAPDLKNNYNCMKRDCNGGDGIHLSPDAYRAMLYTVCDTVNSLFPAPSDSADTADSLEAETENVDDIQEPVA